MKKKILYIAAIIICLSVISGSTFAYFTASDTARNVITSGGIDVSVVEQQLVDGSLQPYPGQPIPIMPSGSVSKIVAVQSHEQEAWVRASYAFTVLDAEDNVLDIPEEELREVIIIEPDSSKWMYYNGWWYCKRSLGGGEMSSPLFEKVCFSGEGMDNKYQLCTVIIDVTVQAVQKANNGGNVFAADGWPEI